MGKRKRYCHLRGERGRCYQFKGEKDGVSFKGGKGEVGVSLRGRRWCQFKGNKQVVVSVLGGGEDGVNLRG